MKRKDLILNKLLELNDPKGIDTKTLSSILNITRSNVSHDLNTLCKEGKVRKSSGRPVLFFPMSLNSKKTKNKISKLDELLKNNISLKRPIEQAKAAILYPPKGLNTLILGNTGVGKSMFASLMHEYAVEMGAKSKDSPFLVFNCADYSNNPQLLTSQLFGVKKGSYTGAEIDRIGLIEKANGGILFLDEVHRLPPEGQEALFTFLDTGSFSRMGDHSVRKSNVLIISATTENPDSALLQTFIRRIPMVITIPSLKNRTLEERLHLIKSFFKYESIKLNKDIHVSLNTIRSLLSYNCPNNIGQLKSDIQLVCAKAYSDFLTNIKSDINITSGNLPHHIKEGLYHEKEHRVLWNRLIGENIKFFKFSPSDKSNNILDEPKNSGIYGLLEQRLEKLKSIGISTIAIENILEKNITKYFDKSINGVSEDANKKNLLNILGIDVLDLIDKIVYSMVTSLKRNLSNNAYTALALHIDTLIKRINNREPITNPQLNKIKELYPKEFKAANNAKKILESHLHHKIPEDETGYLTIFLLPEEEIDLKTVDKVKIIIIAHGDSTATSMAKVANDLLGEDYVIGINAPLQKSPSTILETLKEIVKNNFSSKGYLLLVDMGSLTTFADSIKSDFKVPVKVIPLASTLHVIEATRKALLGFSLDHIYESVLSVNSYVEKTKFLEENTGSDKKIAIITACLTGKGGSVAIKSFLKNNLRYDKNLFEIICLNCLDKKHFKQKLKEIQESKEILFIVSSFPVKSHIKEYNIYDVMSMQVINELQEDIDTKTTLIKMALVLKENIDNIDGEELYNDIIDVLSRIQNKLSIKLSDENLIALILHLAFMISKLKKGKTSYEYPNKEKFLNENKDLYNIIKKQFIVIFNKYFIEIPDNEICYIIRFFNNSKE